MSNSYDPKKRAEEKRLSREEDARAIASGEKSREQLRRENGAFGFAPSEVRIYPGRAKRLS